MAEKIAQKKTRQRRKATPEERRLTIIHAGLSVFAAEGFSAAKLEDVARKAGVAKGTIYLYFRDKDDLFEQIVRSAVEPVLEQLQTITAIPDIPTKTLLANIFEMFRTQILETDRKLVLQLLLAEGSRFPKIAEFYYNHVISRGFMIIRLIAKRAESRGELLSSEISQFPHLVFAPLMMTIVWDGLFSKFEPLDVEALLSAHQKIITRY